MPDQDVLQLLKAFGSWFLLGHQVTQEHVSLLTYCWQQHGNLLHICHLVGFKKNWAHSRYVMILLLSGRKASCWPMVAIYCTVLTHKSHLRCHFFGSPGRLSRQTISSPVFRISRQTIEADNLTLVTQNGCKQPNPSTAHHYTVHVYTIAWIWHYSIHSQKITPHQPSTQGIGPPFSASSVLSVSHRMPVIIPITMGIVDYIGCPYLLNYLSSFCIYVSSQ